MLVWFAVYNLGANGPTEQWSDTAWGNVLGGFIAGAWLLVAVGFTVAQARRRGGTDFGTPMDFLFCFDKTNGVAAGLAVIFNLPTSGTAAVAGSRTTTAGRQSVSSFTHVA